MARDPRLQRRDESLGDQATVEGPDGVMRTKAQEQLLNRNMFAPLHGSATREQAQAVVQYLRDITINHANGPGVDDRELRHREGMRWLFSIMMVRSEQGRTGDPQ